MNRKQPSLLSKSHFQWGLLIFGLIVLAVGMGILITKSPNVGQATAGNLVCDQQSDAVPTCIDTDGGINYGLPGGVLHTKETLNKFKSKPSVITKKTEFKPDVCTSAVGGKGDSYIQENYCESGELKSVTKKCSETEAGISCDPTGGACAPECTKESDCGNLEVCLDQQCAEIFQEIKCTGDLYDTSKRNKVTLYFGGYTLGESDLPKLGISYYNLFAEVASYPFEDFCLNETKVFEVSCNNEAAESKIIGQLTVTDKKLVESGLAKVLPDYGTLVYATALNCPKGTQCFEGACVTPGKLVTTTKSLGTTAANKLMKIS